MADDIKTKKPQKTEQEKKELINKAKKKGIKVERPKPTKPKEEKNKPKPKEEKKKTGRIYCDYTMLFMIIFLLVFGVIMIYSASSYTAGIKFKDSAYFVKNQIKYTLFGFVIFVVMMFIPYKKWVKRAYIWYGGSIFLSAVVLAIGKSVNGSKRWIVVGPVRFQPSEFVKVTLILFITYYLVKYKDELYSSDRKVTEHRLWWLFLWVIIPVVLVLVANLSTSIIIFLIALGMSFIGTSNKRLFTAGTLAFAAILASAKPLVKLLYSWGFRNYRLMRLLVWAEPEKFSRDVGSGGVFGKGLGQGMQKFFIPEAQNDMIFSIIVEEFGIIGVLMILAVFAFIIRRMLIIAFSVKDLEGRYIVIGVVIHLSLQVILNIAVVTGVMPNTGVSLPFISYGGSSIVVLLAEIGLVYSVARTIKME